MVEEIVKKTTENAKVNPSYMVRVNSDTQKIDKFFQSTNKPETSKIETSKIIEDVNNDDDVEMECVEEKKGSTLPKFDVKETENLLENSLVLEPNETNKMPDKWKSAVADQANMTYIDPKESFKTRTFKYERIETKLTSVKQLRLDVENKCNSNLREILANLIFIACIDCHKSLIQHSIKLYLCDTTRLT